MKPENQPLQPGPDVTNTENSSGHTPGSVVSPTPNVYPDASHGQLASQSDPSSNVTPPPAATQYGVEPLPDYLFGQPPQTPSGNGGRFGRLFSNKKKYALLAVPTLLLLSGAAAFFGYYLPNKPERVWSTALSRTAQGYDKLAEYISEKKDRQGLAIKGTFKLTGTVAADGKFEGKSADDNGEYSGSISAGGGKVNLDIKTIKSPGNSPDIYFKLTGLEGIGDLLGGSDETATSAFNSLNNQWYFIDHTLFDQFAPGTNNSTQITSEDVSSILKAVGDSTKAFVFTDDPKKAVFEIKKTVGKEKMDGRGVYHYQVSFVKKNLTAYVDSLCQNLINSKFSKFFNGDTDAAKLALDCQGLKDDVNKLDEAKLADAWVDLKTKLISKVRFSYSSGQPKSKSTGDVELGAPLNYDEELAAPELMRNGYIEIAQKYFGGDVFPLIVSYQEESRYTDSDYTITASGRLGVTLDMKSDSVSLSGEFQTKDSSSIETGSFDLTISPSNQEVKVEKPAESKNLIQLLNDIGFGELFGSGGDISIGSTSDTERKTDINALHGQVEAYYALNGSYPALAEINNASWRSANMKGLDPAALQDPAGTIQQLAATASFTQYGYAIFQEDGSTACTTAAGDCVVYTLTAKLDDGGSYTKASLN